MIEARPSALEDWEGLKDCWETLKNSRHAWKIVGDLPVLRAYFENSRVFPQLFVPVLVEDATKFVLGFSICQECTQPLTVAEASTGETGLHTFIRAVYIRAGVVPEDSAKLDAIMSAWGVSRKHEFTMGNCRKDMPERYLKQYGFEISHVVVKKSLKEVK